MFKEVTSSQNPKLITTDAAIMFDNSTSLTDNLSYYMKTFTLTVNDTVAIDDIHDEREKTEKPSDITTPK